MGPPCLCQLPASDMGLCNPCEAQLATTFSSHINYFLLLNSFRYDIVLEGMCTISQSPLYYDTRVLFCQ